MSEVLAYHISFTTYGTWLPGDERGWVEAETEGIQKPNPRLHEMVQYALAEEPFNPARPEQQQDLGLFGVDVEGVLAQVEAARQQVAAGSLDLRPPLV